MKKNQRKLRKLAHYDNVIIFPGTYEKYVRDGERYLSEHQYEKAIEAFDGAIQLEPTSTQFLFLYAVALYEMKDFLRAREFALLALEHGNGEYIVVMELYLTILIQLEAYEEVEISIQALIEEGFIPPEMMSKFIYLRDLNRRLSVRYGEDELAEVASSMTFEEFKEKDLYAQQQFLTSLKGIDLERSIGLLEEIIASPIMPPSVITFSLMLLKEVQYDELITVEKYGQQMKVKPSVLTLPGQDLLSEAVLHEVEKKLEKDPSKLQFVDSAIRKFVINAFPFQWGEDSAEVIANAYIEYIECLMMGEAISDNPLLEFIQKVDQEADF